MDRHGLVASRSQFVSPAATVTHVDGLVLARSVFEHGVNYCSVTVYGTARLVTNPVEELAGLRCLTEQATPGQCQPPGSTTRSTAGALSSRGSSSLLRLFRPLLISQSMCDLSFIPFMETFP